MKVNKNFHRLAWLAHDTEPRETKKLAEVERKHMVKALQEMGWKIEGHKGAAQLLGIHPSTMRARMRKLGIRRPGTH